MADIVALEVYSPLRKVFERNRAGDRKAVYSVCSAHPQVIRAALELARDRHQLAVIESTCNQVNQDGGYTGMMPAEFAKSVRSVARDVDLPDDQLVLGGDHLGPQPWRKLPAETAMAKAVTMVEAYASAGYGKLHLDCSMACADDEPSLSDTIIAERAARLARAAEEAIVEGASRPIYIVGTEVPAPGGMGEGHEIVPTTSASMRATWRAHERAFNEVGLTDALARVVAIVVQPGLDFGNEGVKRFAPNEASDLSAAVLALEGMVYEAHSTDYQTPDAYEALVQMHFAILKVGPAATFALREAIFALEHIARELPDWNSRYSVRSALEAAMMADPAHWASHYDGDANRQSYLRQFSLSDRLRYYWAVPSVENAVAGLFEFVDTSVLPMPLISQFLPQHARDVATGDVATSATTLCRAHIKLALVPYADACGLHSLDAVGV